MSATFLISLFDNKTDNQPKEKIVTWADFCACVRKPHVRARKDGSAFAPCRFEPSLRRKENVRFLSMLVYDIDAQIELDALRRKLHPLESTFAVYSTHSHRRRTDKNPQAESRWRVVLPLAETVEASEFSELWHTINAALDLRADENARDASRMHFIPAKANTGAEYEHAIEADENFFRWRAFLASFAGKVSEQGESETNAPEASYAAETSRFASWDELNAELKRRFMAQAKLNGRGIYEMRGICHAGQGETALMFNPATGAVHCNKDCTHATILRAFGLPEKPNSNAATNAAPEREQSKATRLVALASSVEFFYTPENRTFARVTVNDHIETVSVKSGAFRDWLIREHRQREGTTPGAQALQDALNDLQGTARFDSPQRECHTRIAEHEGAIYVDLCNDAWQAVRVTSTGWSVIESKDLPVMFRRTRGMLALPMPQEGGRLSDLQHFINVRPEDWSLVAAWLVAAFRPNRPFAVLTLNGEQGSAKSTTARVLRALIDPNKAALRSVQRDERELMIAATNGWIVALDNLSNLRAWLSDSLCRLSTGGGFAARENYSDDEEVLFDAMRPVLLNGIEELATRSDLLDRAIIVTLPTIAEEDRREQEEVWREFELARPRLFGAVLAAVSTALHNFPNTQLGRKPRMADFARWSVAAETAFDCAPGSFLTAYTTNRTAANELALEAAPVASVVLSFVEEVETWSGTAGELLKEISPRAGDTTHLEGWAKSPRALSGTLKRLAPNLRASGVEVATGIRTTNGRRIIRLEKTRKVSSLSSLRHFTPDLQAETSDDASDANGGSDESGKSSSLENSDEYGLSDGSAGSDNEIHDFSNHVLSDEEAELAAQFEYYGATREEADQTARQMFQEVSF